MLIGHTKSYSTPPAVTLLSPKKHPPGKKSYSTPSTVTSLSWAKYDVVVLYSTAVNSSPQACVCSLCQFFFPHGLTDPWRWMWGPLLLGSQQEVPLESHSTIESFQEDIQDSADDVVRSASVMSCSKYNSSGAKG